MQASVRFERTRSVPTQRTADEHVASRPSALRLRGVCKQFGDQRILDDAELDVAPGRIVGLVGESGSGKTTVLSMATGLLPADEGSVRIFDVDACADRATTKSLLGVVPDAPSIPEHVTGRESLICTGMLRGVDGESIALRVDDVLRTVGLTDAAATTVAHYSTGMRKRLCLAAALLHRPRLLVLDEPFEGVDAESAEVIRAVVRDLAASGAAVLVSSRGPALIEGLCDSVATIVDGRISWSADMLGETTELGLACA